MTEGTHLSLVMQEHNQPVTHQKEHNDWLTKTDIGFSIQTKEGFVRENDRINHSGIN